MQTRPQNTSCRIVPRRDRRGHARRMCLKRFCQGPVRYRHWTLIIPPMLPKPRCSLLKVCLVGCQCNQSRRLHFETSAAEIFALQTLAVLRNSLTYQNRPGCSPPKAVASNTKERQYRPLEDRYTDFYWRQQQHLIFCILAGQATYPYQI